MSALAATPAVLAEVLQERANQEARWGEQNHPDGSGGPEYAREAEWARDYCQHAAARGSVTWADILTEEFYEALAESDPEKLREELVQVAAVAVSWVECLDRMRRGR